MGKANKNKKNKVPKINEEEYAAYIAQLKKEPKSSTQDTCVQENMVLLDSENKQK